MKTISTDQLNQIFSLIIKKLHNDGVTEVKIEVDLYRFIPTDKWSNFDKEEILSGSLYDDLNSLQLLLKDRERIVTYVDFDRTASILRAISEILNPVD